MKFELEIELEAEEAKITLRVDDQVVEEYKAWCEAMAKIKEVVDKTLIH